MQSAEALLSILREKSTQRSEYVFERLYRNLFNEDFYLLAYSNLYAKEGHMAKGIDEKTIGGLNIALVKDLIEKMRRETYSPNSVYSLSTSKKCGKSCPSEGPSFTDKLVQEVLRLILEAIYEPLFQDSSHGFRPGRNCHTALTQIKTNCQGTSWVIEGDIKGFFDNIDHARMLELLSRKIQDGRFLYLINKFLKAGYMEFQRVPHSLTGTSRGEIISHVLTNIYLHELDVFMATLCAHYSPQGNVSTEYRSYVSLDQPRSHADEDSEQELARKYYEPLSRLPSDDPLDPNTSKITYTRYVDDFVVMIIGNKHLAVHVRDEIKAFLYQNLKLELDMEKTLITNLSDQRVCFLGYEIARSRGKTAYSHGSQKRAANESIQLLVPGEVIQKQLEPFVRNGKAVHHPARINSPVLETLRQYNAEIRGLYNYYRLATDVSKKIGKFRYYHYHSLLKTIARKEKSTMAQVLDKYGVEIKRKNGTGTRKVFGTTYQTREGTQTMIYFSESIKKEALKG